jgi:hypothetical protein
MREIALLTREGCIGQVRTQPADCSGWVHYPFLYSTSVVSLNSAVNLMLPCPNCGYPGVLGSAA